MSVEPLACPYCNALVPLPPNARDGQRVTCPRCGDAFPLRGVSVGIQAPPGVSTAPTQAVPALPVPRAGHIPPARSRNRAVVAVVLTLMALMAAAGLTFALLSQAQRRANDTNLARKNRQPIFPEPDDPSPTKPVGPDQLEALAYLPSHSNAVLGIEVRRLRQSKSQPAGLKLLTDPIKIGKDTVKLADLLRWTGLKVEELDHVVVEARIEDVGLPRIVLVARTIGKIDRRRVTSTLDAEERDGPHRGQTVYRFKVPNLAPEATAWFADDRTIVIDLRHKLDDVPTRPQAGLDHLPFALRDALKRVPPDSVVWLVGAVDDWEKIEKKLWFQAAEAFGALEKGRLDRLRSLRVLAAGAQLGPDAEAVAMIRCKDAAAALALRGELVGPEGGDPPGVTAVLDNDWLSVRWKGSADALLKALAK